MNMENKPACQAQPENGPGEHAHSHPHGHGPHDHSAKQARNVISIRSHSGLSGDMLLCGLAVCAMLGKSLEPGSAEASKWLAELLGQILPTLANSVKIGRRSINGIAGWQATVRLEEDQPARTFADIKKLIMESLLPEPAKDFALRSFELLAACEADVHGTEIDKVHFHEVGALDSILDICGVCALYVTLGQPLLGCSPLPVADGDIHCCHGILTAPAPASLRLLAGLPVRPFAGDAQAGELLTPTALALLKALPVQFGPWPQCRIVAAPLVYGSREFANAANGAIFVMGEQPGH